MPLDRRGKERVGIHQDILYSLMFLMSSIVELIFPYYVTVLLNRRLGSVKA